MAQTQDARDTWTSLLAAIDEALPNGVLPEERRLIAAAPEMLVLVQYVDYAVGESMDAKDADDDVLPVHMTIKAIRDLRALLARIEGAHHE